MPLLCVIINTVSSEEYLKHSVLTIGLLQIPEVRFYKASLSKMAPFFSLMLPPHYLFTPSSSPITKDLGMHRWVVSFDRRLSPSSAGPGAVLVRRHDRHGAAGSDPPAGGPQQGGGRLRSAAESEEQVADPALPGSSSWTGGTSFRPPAGLCVRTRDPDAFTQQLCWDVETINCAFYHLSILFVQDS